MYVNLGVGIPTLVPPHLPADIEIMLQSENGALGVGPPPLSNEEDPDLVNANERPITLVDGASLFSHADAFLMIRGGHLDVALLGAFEVSQHGDLASWSTGRPGEAPAVGGAMDLAVGAKEIWVLMHHVTKDESPRIVMNCSYPLTGRSVVTRIFTDMAIINVTPDGLIVEQIAHGLSFHEIQDVTSAPLQIADNWRWIENY